MEAKGSLDPCVLVERGERYGEAAQPFVLKSLVDSATALLFVLQDVGLNLVGFFFRQSCFAMLKGNTHATENG